MKGELSPLEHRMSTAEIFFTTIDHPCDLIKTYLFIVTSNASFLQTLIDDTILDSASHHYLSQLLTNSISY